MFVKYTGSARKDGNEVRAFPDTIHVVWYTNGSSVSEKNDHFIGRERSKGKGRRTKKSQAILNCKFGYWYLRR